jgi:hypothetical protein
MRLLMRDTLFVHVPKTGGTTLDALLAQQLPAEKQLRGIQFSGPVEKWAQLSDPAFSYVSGHLPAGATVLNDYRQRITILREPLQLLASMISYNDVVDGPQSFVRRALEARTRLSAYAEYFSPGFDLVRMVTDLRYGLAQSQTSYAMPCTPEQALRVLQRFDRVLDFRRLDAEIQRILIEDRLFPPSVLGRARSYRYKPDLGLAKKLLTGFDKAFYAKGSACFRPLPDNMDECYAGYRREYCAAHGLRPAAYGSTELPLRGPVGTGWLHPNCSELGDWFRWALVRDPLIDIPVAEGGTFEVRLYVHPHRVQRIAGELSAGTDQLISPMTVSEHGDMCLLQAKATLAGSGWLQVRMNCEPHADDESADQGQMQTLYFVLGRMLVTRHHPSAG